MFSEERKESEPVSASSPTSIEKSREFYFKLFEILYNFDLMGTRLEENNRILDEHLSSLNISDLHTEEESVIPLFYNFKLVGEAALALVEEVKRFPYHTERNQVSRRIGEYRKYAITEDYQENPFFELYYYEGSILNFVLHSIVKGDVALNLVQKLGNKLDIMNPHLEFNSTPIQLASSLNRAEILSALLNTYIETRLISYNVLKDISPIHYAAYRGNDKCLTILFDDGRFNDEVNRYDKYGRTPLHAAVIRGNLKCFEILLDLNFADLNIKTGLCIRQPGGFEDYGIVAVPGESILDLIKFYKRKEMLEIVETKFPQLLLDSLNTSASSPSYADQLLHDHEAEYTRNYNGNLLSAAGELEALIRYIRIKGPKALEETNKNGDNLLHTACSYAQIEIVKFLLNKERLEEIIGVIPEQDFISFVNKTAGSQHITPVGRAIYLRDAQKELKTTKTSNSLIKLFINSKFYNINQYYCTLASSTLLHYSCKNDKEDLVKEIFRRKDLQPNTKDGNDAVALRHVTNPAIMQIFLNYTRSFIFDVDDGFEDGHIKEALSHWSEESRFGDTVSIPGLNTGLLVQVFRTSEPIRLPGTYKRSFFKLETWRATKKTLSKDEQIALAKTLDKVLYKVVQQAEDIADLRCMVDQEELNPEESRIFNILYEQAFSEAQGGGSYKFEIDDIQVCTIPRKKYTKTTEALFEIRKEHLEDMVEEHLKSSIKSRYPKKINKVEFIHDKNQPQKVEIKVNYNLYNINQVSSSESEEERKGEEENLKQFIFEEGNIKVKLKINFDKEFSKKDKKQINKILQEIYTLASSYYYPQRKPLLHYFVEDAVNRDDISLLSIFLKFPRLSLQQPNDGLKLATSLAKGNSSVLNLLNQALSQTNNLDTSTIGPSSINSSEYREVLEDNLPSVQPAAYRAVDYRAAKEITSSNPHVKKEAREGFLTANFRGLHFNKRFFDSEERRFFALTDQTNKPIFAVDCYANTGIAVQDQLNDSDIGKLNEISTKLNEILLNNFDANINGKQLNHNFIENYVLGRSNKIAKLIQDAEEIIKAAQLRSFNSPVISTSKLPYTAVKFSSGSQGYRELNNDLLRPKYRVHGVPKHRLLGLVYVVMHNIDAYEAKNPFDITKLYKERKIDLPYGINNEPKFLAQLEVALPGKIDAENVVAAVPFLVPNFATPWNNKYKELYNIDQKLYNYYKNRFENSDKEAIKFIENELLGHLEKHYTKLIGNIAESIAAQKGKKLCIAMPDGQYHLYKQNYKDTILADAKKQIDQNPEREAPASAILSRNGAVSSSNLSVPAASKFTGLQSSLTAASSNNSLSLLPTATSNIPSQVATNNTPKWANIVGQWANRSTPVQQPDYRYSLARNNQAELRDVNARHSSVNRPDTNMHHIMRRPNIASAAVDRPDPRRNNNRSRNMNNSNWRSKVNSSSSYEMKRE